MGVRAQVVRAPRVALAEAPEDLRGRALEEHGLAQLLRLMLVEPGEQQHALDEAVEMLRGVGDVGADRPGLGRVQLGPDEHPAHAVDHGQRRPQLVGHVPQELVLDREGCPQPRVRVAPGADVLDDGDEDVGLAVEAMGERHGEVDPGRAAVLAQVALLQRVRVDLAGEQPLALVEVFLHVVRVRDVDERAPHELVGRVPGDLRELPVDTDPATLEVHLRDADGRVVEDAAPAGLAVAQRDLRRVALRHVLEHEPEPPAWLHRRREHVEPAAHRVGALLESQDLAPEAHPGVHLDPMALQIRDELQRRPSGGVLEAGHRLELRVDLQEPVVDRVAGLVQHDLREAEPLVDLLEQRRQVRLAVEAVADRGVRVGGRLGRVRGRLGRLRHGSRVHVQGGVLRMVTAERHCTGRQ